jgi:hypothetical protein
MGMKTRLGIKRKRNDSKTERNNERAEEWVESLGCLFIFT